MAVGGASDPPELYAWPLWQPPLGPTPLQPEGYDSGAMRKCARWGWLNWGVGVSYPPGGIQKGRPVVFSWRQSASRTFSPSIALPTRIRQPILSVGTVGRFALRPTYPRAGGR